MKKIVLPFVIFNLLTFISCKDDKKASEIQEIIDPDSQHEENQKNEISKVQSNEILKHKIPTFDDPKIQKYLAEYKDYIDQYIDAAKAKDINKLTELTKKNQKWIIIRKTILEELSSNPKEFQKYKDYIEKLDSMVAEVMTK